MKAESLEHKLFDNQKILKYIMIAGVSILAYTLLKECYYEASEQFGNFIDYVNGNLTEYIIHR
jgi:hypothetical protein